MKRYLLTGFALLLSMSSAAAATKACRSLGQMVREVASSSSLEGAGVLSSNCYLITSNGGFISPQGSLGAESVSELSRHDVDLVPIVVGSSNYQLVTAVDGLRLWLPKQATVHVSPVGVFQWLGKYSASEPLEIE